MTDSTLTAPPHRAASSPHMSATVYRVDARSAACVTSGLPPSTWDGRHANESRLQGRERLAQARAICATCPLKTACTAQGAKHKESGQWGDYYAADGRPPIRYRASA